MKFVLNYLDDDAAVRSATAHTPLMDLRGLIPKRCAARLPPNESAALHQDRAAALPLATPTQAAAHRRCGLGSAVHPGSPQTSQRLGGPLHPAVRVPVSVAAALTRARLGGRAAALRTTFTSTHASKRPRRRPHAERLGGRDGSRPEAGTVSGRTVPPPHGRSPGVGNAFARDPGLCWQVTRHEASLRPRGDRRWPVS